MNYKRIGLFLKRYRAARRLGVNFTGTTSFRMPHCSNLCGREMALHFPDGDQALALDFINVILDDEYRLKALNSPPQTILDVGANIGLFTLWAHHVFPQARIHSYEPAGTVFDCLYRNAAALDGLTLYREAIGAVCGRSRLENISDSSRINRLEKDTGGDIAITALDAAIQRLGGSVDLLKLDCEGFEWDIFQRPEPFRAVRRIHMEYHLTDGRTIADLRAAAGSIGFAIDRIEENEGFGMAFMQRRTPA